MTKRISINPEVCHGKPVIEGTRVLVTNILGALSAGESFGDILEDYPNITERDICSALAFGAELSRFEEHSYTESKAI